MVQIFWDPLFLLNLRDQEILQLVKLLACSVLFQRDESLCYSCHSILWGFSFLFSFDLVKVEQHTIQNKLDLAIGCCGEGTGKGNFSSNFLKGAQVRFFFFQKRLEGF